MKKYTQKELLEESFWKGVGKTIGGVARGVDYIAGQVAPELQRLYKDPYKAGKGLVSAIKGTPSNGKSKGTQASTASNNSPTATSQETANIRQGLARQQYTLSNTPTLSYVDPRTRIKYFNVNIEKNGRQLNAIVDLNGNFLTP